MTEAQIEQRRYALRFCARIYKSEVRQYGD